MKIYFVVSDKSLTNIRRYRQPEKHNAMSLKRLTAFVLPNGKTGLPRFELRSNLAMTQVETFVSGCLKGILYFIFFVIIFYIHYKLVFLLNHRLYQNIFWLLRDFSSHPDRYHITCRD